MARETESGMRLRGNIQRPIRFEEEQIHLRKPYQRRNGTLPAFPELLASSTVPYDPRQPPAAFPSLPLTGIPPTKQSSVEASTSNPLNEDNRPVPPVVYSQLDISRLISEVVETHKTDYKKSNSIASRDFGGADSFGPASRFRADEKVEWGSLELAYQHRIFQAISRLRDETNAAHWLGLSPEEAVAINAAIRWRQKFPITLAQCHEGQITLQNCMNPELLMAYMDLMVKISHFELGSPLQLLRAGLFLRQLGLPGNLLGTWISDSLGSGQLIDASPLADRLPVGALTSEHLHQMSLQALRGAKLPLQARKPPIHSNMSLQQRPKSPPPTAVRRPRKQTPRLLQELLGTRSSSPALDRTRNPGFSENCTGARGRSNSARLSETSRDQIDLLRPATQPVPQIPAPSSTASSPPASQETAHHISSQAAHSSIMPTSSTPGHNPNSPGLPRTSGISSDDRTAGPMSLRSRGSLRETEAMSALRQTQGFWGSSRDETDPSRSATETVEGGTLAVTPSMSESWPRTPKLILKVSDTGFASVSPGQRLIPSPPSRGGKASSNFAGFEKPASLKSPVIEPTEDDVALPPWSTPQPSILNREPLQPQNTFKQYSVYPDSPEAGPARLGNSLDFSSKLIASPEARPSTPDTGDLGVFGTEDGYISSISVGPADEMDIDEGQALYLPGTIPSQQASDPVLHSSRINHLGYPMESILPSIEEDIEIEDAPMLQRPSLAPDVPAVSAAHSVTVRPKKVVGLRRRLVSSSRNSPPRLGSISPISENEDFDEYHAWLRGEREHGPLPQARAITAAETPRGTKSNPTMATTAVDTLPSQATTPRAQPVTSSEPPPFKIKLQLRLNEEAAPQPPALPGTSLALRFVDPGEEGDESWEDEKPKKKKQKKASTPVRTSFSAANPRSTTPWVPVSHKATESTDGIRKAVSKKGNGAVTGRTTRAQSLAAGEAVKSRPVAEPGTATKDAESSNASTLIPNVKIPLKARPTPRLHRSTTPARSDRPKTRHQTAVQAILDEENVTVRDSASDAESKGANEDSKSAKPRKKWTHKQYHKSRESPRLAIMDLPNMKT